MLITPDALARDLASETPPLVLDVRPAEAFAVSRISGAIHLDLWGVSLIDTSPAPLRAFMWMIGHLFSLRGVTPERAVVVYEGEQTGIRAARVFWLLEYLGHPKVSVLDGGLAAWTRAGRPVTTEVTSPTPSTWHGEPDASKLATWEQVLARLDGTDAAIVDTRAASEFFAEEVRAKRGGAIPGAVNLEWKQNLNPDGTFKSPDELRAQYAALGVTSDREVITYCQGGYRAAHTYLALRLLGFPNVRNYTGSWKEWGDRDDLPLVKMARPS